MLAIVTSLVIAGVALGLYRDLRKVTVTVQHQGAGSPSSRASSPPAAGRIDPHARHIPPISFFGGTGPYTYTFKTPVQLKYITQALNRDHIAVNHHPIPNNGCSGGTTITISILTRSPQPSVISGYECGGKLYGGISGNVNAFLSSVEAEKVLLAAGR